MMHFLGRRTLHLIISLVILSLVTFVLLHIAPGGPAQALLGPDQVSIEAERAVEARLGLHEPYPVQFGKWVTSLAQGDFGNSYYFRQSALDVVLDRLPSSLVLGGISTIIAILVGVPSGVIAARKPGGILDRISSSSAVVLVSLPTFWLGILLIYLFSVQLGILPSSGTGRTNGDGWMPDWRNLVLPSLAMALPAAATFMLYTRSAMFAALANDSIRTARGMGLSERKILFGHAFPQAIAPVLMQIGLFLPHLVEGSIVIETVFSWPGVGQLTTASVGRRDYPILLALTLVVGFGTILASMVADFLHARLDPRIELR